MQNQKIDFPVDIRDEYEATIRAALKREYDNMIYWCKKTREHEEKDNPIDGFVLGDEFKSTSGFDTFQQVAKSCGYILGQSWRLKGDVEWKDGNRLINSKSLCFVTAKTINVPFHRGGKKQIANTEHEGFGLKLSVRGWAYLSGLTMSAIRAELDAGSDIESIWINHGVSAQREPERVCEAVGYGSRWVRVSNEDMSQLEAAAEGRGVSVAEFLHGIVETALR